MTKRVLVVDNGINDFQYMIVDMRDDGVKEISKYYSVDEHNHNSYYQAKTVMDVFDDNKCDEIYIDGLGSGHVVIAGIGKMYHSITTISRTSAQGRHETICSLMDDIRKGKLFICSDSSEIFDVISGMKKEQTIYCDCMGRCKIGKFTDSIVRRKIQLVLGMYECLNHGYNYKQFMEWR